MTAVVAEGRASARRLGRPGGTSAARGGPADRLWVDDSKVVYPAARAATGSRRRAWPRSPPRAGAAGHLGGPARRRRCGDARRGRVDPLARGRRRRWRRGPATGLACEHWRIVEVRTVVVGPARFNAELARPARRRRSTSRRSRRLLGARLGPRARGLPRRRPLRQARRPALLPAALADAFPDVWIDRGPEGPELSRYTLRDGPRRLELSLSPRADAADGLVALASIVSKTVRERWMDVFNAHWTARIPDLRPTAGYPSDSARFRQAIEAACLERGLDPSVWWRAR